MSSEGKGPLVPLREEAVPLAFLPANKRIAELEQDNAALVGEVQRLKRELSDRDAEAKQFKAEISRLHDELDDAKRKSKNQSKAVQLLMSGRLGELATEAALKAVRGEG